MKLFRKERPIGTLVYWAQKIVCMGPSKTQRIRRWMGKRSRKKVRGSEKKRFLALEKRKYPKGRPMYKKVAPPHRQIIYTKDIERLMHYTPRNARRYLARIRKKLQKPKGEIITLAEFCSKTPFKEADVIPYLV